jgi:hypothetical protein
MPSCSGTVSSVGVCHGAKIIIDSTTSSVENAVAVDFNCNSDSVSIFNATVIPPLRFGKQTKKIEFPSQPQFNHVNQLQFPRCADFASNAVLIIKQHKLVSRRTKTRYYADDDDELDGNDVIVAYVDMSALALIKNISLKTNNETLAESTPLGMLYTSEMSTIPQKSLIRKVGTCHNDMQGVVLSTVEWTAVIPLDFSCFKHLHLALPLGEMQHSPLYLTVETRSFKDIVQLIPENEDDYNHYEVAQAHRPSNAPQLDMYVECDFYIVHKCERNVRRGQDYDYLWFVDEIFEENTVTLRNPHNQFVMHFSPTKLMLWMGMVTQPKFLSDGQYNMISQDYFNYGSTTESGEPFENIKVMAGNIELSNRCTVELTETVFDSFGCKEREIHGITLPFTPCIQPYSAAPNGCFAPAFLDKLTAAVTLCGPAAGCPTENNITIITKNYQVYSRHNNSFYLI